MEYKSYPSKRLRWDNFGLGIVRDTFMDQFGRHTHTHTHKEGEREGRIAFKECKQSILV